MEQSFSAHTHIPGIPIPVPDIPFHLCPIKPENLQPCTLNGFSYVRQIFTTDRLHFTYASTPASWITTYPFSAPPILSLRDNHDKHLS